VKVPKVFKKGQDPVFQLLVSEKGDHTHSLFFYSADAQAYWHSTILKAQGFWEDPSRQYQFITKIGAGGYGDVFLARHRNSDA